MTQGWDTNWECFFQESDGNQYPDVAVIRFVARNFYQVPDRSQINILDMGCGTGAHLWYLAREGFSTFGLEGSSTAVDKAAARMAACGLSCEVGCGDFTRLPYPDDSMDAILDVTAIQHNPKENIPAILEEVRRVLKDGGKFFSKYIAEELVPNLRLRTTYFTLEDVRAYFSVFSDLAVDFMEYTDCGGRQRSKFWLIQGRVDKRR